MDEIKSESLLSLKFGRRIVKENLNHAIAEGRLLRLEDGSLMRTGYKQKTWWSNGQKLPPNPPCGFLDMLFECAYDRSAVPYGCRNCYKVKVSPRTLREMVALKGISEGFHCYVKCGVFLDNIFTQDAYGGFFYADGLDEAKKIYHLLREVVNTTPKLGPAIPMSIKRGCTHFEMHCGPSDKYTFRPELPALEEYLLTQYKPQKQKKTSLSNNKAFILFSWVKSAFSIGDDTYLDFTGGKRLFPKTVTYPVGDK